MFTLSPNKNHEKFAFVFAFAQCKTKCSLHQAQYIMVMSPNFLKGSSHVTSALEFFFDLCHAVLYSVFTLPDTYTDFTFTDTGTDTMGLKLNCICVGVGVCVGVGIGMDTSIQFSTTHFYGYRPV